MMATDELDESWGTAIGTSSVAGYGARTNSTYRGWSSDYVGQILTHSSVDSTGDGLVLQQLARRYGYSGPLDGVPGPLTWLALQSTLQDFGYEGPLDGVPAINTYRALQELAKQGGYAGPVDGLLGPNTFSALQRFARG